MLRKNIFITILLLISTCTLLTGCWDRAEIRDLGIVGAIALDLEGDKIKLTCEFMKPQMLESTANEDSATIIQSTGKTIFDALTNTTMKFDNKFYMPHTKAYIYSEDFARKGLSDFIDYFNRNHEGRRFVNIFIKKGSNASDVIGVDAGQTNLPEAYIEKISKNQKKNAKTVSVTVLDFLQDYYSEGKEPIVGLIDVRAKGKVPTTDKYSQDKMYPEYELISEGSAVFLSGKLVGFLDGIETRGYNWITGKVVNTVVVSTLDKEKNTVAVRIEKQNVKTNVIYDGKKATIDITLKLEGIVKEIIGESDVKKLDYMNEIRKQTALVIKNEMENTIDKVMKQYKSDVFGFGSIYHKTHPYKWKKIKNEWNEIFSKAQVNLDVSVSISRTGSLVDTMNSKEQK